MPSARSRPDPFVSARSPSTPQPAGPPSLLRFPAVKARTGLSRSTIWRLERRGAFPRHRRISPNAVAWLEQEVSDWIQATRDDTLGVRAAVR